MVNTDYRIEAVELLLNENCILKRFYPLIPHRHRMVEQLKLRGCVRKSEAMRYSDRELQDVLQEEHLVGLFRGFLTMYDPKPGKMREIASVAVTPQEAEAFGELYLLPGVKSTRARLYRRAGFGTLEQIAAATPGAFMEACEKVIEANNLALKPPLMKEARTHIAVARAFTDEME